MCSYGSTADPLAVKGQMPPSGAHLWRNKLQARLLDEPVGRVTLPVGDASVGRTMTAVLPCSDLVGPHLSRCSLTNGCAVQGAGCVALGSVNPPVAVADVRVPNSGLTFEGSCLARCFRAPGAIETVSFSGTSTGYTSSVFDAVESSAVPGSAPPVNGVQVAGTGATFRVTVVGGDITGLVVSDGGTGYAVGNVLTLSAAAIGGGSGETIVVTSVRDAELTVPCANDAQCPGDAVCGVDNCADGIIDDAFAADGPKGNCCMEPTHGCLWTGYWQAPATAQGGPTLRRDVCTTKPYSTSAKSWSALGSLRSSRGTCTPSSTWTPTPTASPASSRFAAGRRDRPAGQRLRGRQAGLRAHPGAVAVERLGWQTLTTNANRVTITGDNFNRSSLAFKPTGLFAARRRRRARARRFSTAASKASVGYTGAGSKVCVLTADGTGCDPSAPCTRRARSLRR